MNTIDQLNRLKNKLSAQQKDAISTVLAATILLISLAEFSGSLSTLAPLFSMLPEQLLSDLLKIQAALSAMALFIVEGNSAQR